jgi:hypothetical protein
MLKIKAKLPSAPTQNVKVPSTAQVAQYSLVAYHKGELKEVVTARFFFSGRDGMSPLRCAMWVHGGGEHYYSGSGSASGCGYHKYSAALQVAIDSAGIELYGSAYAQRDEKPDYKKRARIGVGDEAMHDAMHAIAIACGYRGARLIVK